MAVLVNERTRKALVKAAEHPHNLAFSGAKGMGKHTMAVEIAKRYLGSVSLSNHPDFTEISDDGGVIKKEQIDEIIELSSYKPMASAHRVFIIDGAQRMSEAAQNALLKTLEDEDETNVFILINQGRLLNTILSRCTEIEFGVVPYDMFAQGTDKYAYLASMGAPGAVKDISENEKFNAILRQIPSVIGSRKDLLRLLNETNPKDPQNFFENATEDEKLWLLNFINWYLLLSYIPDVSEYIGMDIDFQLFKSDDKKIRNMAYTASLMLIEFKEGLMSKNGFFDYILKLTEEVE